MKKLSKLSNFISRNSKINNLKISNKRFYAKKDASLPDNVAVILSGCGYFRWN